MEQEQFKPSDLQKNIILQKLIGEMVKAYTNVASGLDYIPKSSEDDFQHINVREKDLNIYCIEKREHYNKNLISGFIKSLVRCINTTKKRLNHLIKSMPPNICTADDIKYDFVTFPLSMITKKSIRNISADCCNTYYTTRLPHTKKRLVMWIIHVDVLLLELEALKQMCITVRGILDKDISEICKEIQSTYVKYIEENSLIKINKHLKKTLYYTQEAFQDFVKDFNSGFEMIQFVPYLDEVRDQDLKGIMENTLLMLRDMDPSDRWSYINVRNHIENVNNFFKATNGNEVCECIAELMRCLVEVMKINDDIKKSMVHQNFCDVTADLFMRYSWYYHYNIAIHGAEEQWRNYKELVDKKLCQDREIIDREIIDEFIELKILKLKKYINDLGTIDGLGEKQIVHMYKRVKNHILQNKLLLLKTGRIFINECIKLNFLSSLIIYANKLFYFYIHDNGSIPFDVNSEDVETFKEILTNQPPKCHLKYTSSINPESLLAVLFENLEVFTSINFTFEEIYCNVIETSLTFINQDSSIKVSCHYTYPEIILEILCVLSNHFLSDFDKKIVDERLTAMRKVIAIDDIISQFIPSLEKQIVNCQNCVDFDNAAVKTIPTDVLPSILSKVTNSFIFDSSDKKTAAIQKLLISILKDREHEQQKSELFSLGKNYICDKLVYTTQQKNINVHDQDAQEQNVNMQSQSAQMRIIKEKQDAQMQDTSWGVLQKRKNELTENAYGAYKKKQKTIYNLNLE